jgi:DNA-binding transcriptional ArsR family regulator
VPRRRAAPVPVAGSGGPAAPGAEPGFGSGGAPAAGRPAPAATPGAGATDDLFRVLADPTRRRILDLLAEDGTLTVGELAARFPDLVASGISKHLMILRAAGLVRSTRDGRQRRYRIDPDTMSSALIPWLAKYAPYWAGALDRLRALAEGEGSRPPG